MNDTKKANTGDVDELLKALTEIARANGGNAVAFYVDFIQPIKNYFEEQ